MERVKTFEDARALTGRSDVPEFSDTPEDMRDFFKALYKASVITEALNEGEKLHWGDLNQKKWYPWFRVYSGGFVFHDATYCDLLRPLGCASRLCFKSRELAGYAGKQFIDIWEAVIK